MRTLTPEEVADLLDQIYPGVDPREAAVAVVVSLLFAVEANDNDVSEFFEDVRETYRDSLAAGPQLAPVCAEEAN